MSDGSLTTGQRRNSLRVRPLLQVAGARVPRGLPRFLLAGGAVSALNWLVRFPLSAVLPFWIAVALAYAIGMACAFELYRKWVFPGSTLRLASQALRFVGVNLAGLATVVGGAAVLAAALRSTLSAGLAEALGHAVAIVAGAAVNYLGHRIVSFARRPRA